MHWEEMTVEQLLATLREIRGRLNHCEAEIERRLFDREVIPGYRLGLRKD